MAADTTALAAMALTWSLGDSDATKVNGWGGNGG